MFCPNCGTKQNNGSNFCSACGTKIHNEGKHSTTSGLENDAAGATKAEQLDLTTRLIGKNAHYYTNNWKRLGQFKGWNWAAFIFMFAWFGYRKMYNELFALVIFYVIAFSILLLRTGIDVDRDMLGIFFELAFSIFCGYRANKTYKVYIEKMKLNHLNNPDQYSLEKIGGTSLAGLFIGLALHIVLLIIFW